VSEEGHTPNRFAAAQAEAAEAFLGRLQADGFKVLFPDQVAVPAEWLLRLFTLTDPDGVADFTKVPRRLSETEAARLFHRLRDHIAGLETKES
jgi:hypothetical protein